MSRCATWPKRWPPTWPNYSAPLLRPISATRSRCSTSGPTTREGWGWLAVRVKRDEELGGAVAGDGQAGAVLGTVFAKDREDPSRARPNAACAVEDAAASSPSPQVTVPAGPRVSRGIPSGTPRRRENGG